mmetsp:Transcript_17406/g.24967  ORF Transcript_17406/g.24967 Transcript_17406/m.24967 type:complete len:116 (+) Transcript_17406:1247-1594(+)
MRFLRIRLFADEDSFGMADGACSCLGPVSFGVPSVCGLGDIWIGASSFFGPSDDETDAEPDDVPDGDVEDVELRRAVNELPELGWDELLEELRIFTGSALEDCNGADELLNVWSP